MYTGSLGTISNRETWSQDIDVVDENGDDVNISTASISLAVRKRGDTSPVLTASVGSGITVATPTFTWTFSVSDMGNLSPGLYDVGCTILRSGVTTQLIVGTATIVDGIVA